MNGDFSLLDSVVRSILTEVTAQNNIKTTSCNLVSMRTVKGGNRN